MDFSESPTTRLKTLKERHDAKGQWWNNGPTSQSKSTKTTTWRSLQFSKLIILSIIGISSMVPQAKAFLPGSRISIDPVYVQSENVDITFYGWPDESSIPAGGYIQLLVPQDIIAYDSGFSCFNVMTQSECKVTGSGTTFTIEVDKEIGLLEQFEYRINNAIQNPISEKPSGIFKMLTSESEIEPDAAGMRVVAERGRMYKFTMSPESEVVGATTELAVRFRGEHLFPKGGYIRMIFPKWNPEQPIEENQKPYITAQGLGSEAACGPLENLSEGLVCNFQNDVLSVRNSAKDNKQSNLELAFKVKGFKNPISAESAYGFKLQTAVYNGGQFYVIDEGEASVVATQYATLSSPNLRVYNDTGIDEKAGMIQELNDMEIQFFLPVPLNPGCQLKIILPEQYSVDEIETLTTRSAFGGRKDYSVANRNLQIRASDRSLVLKDVCGEYIESNKVAIIIIKSLRQPNYEKTTDSITIEITTKPDITGVGAPIAKVDQKVTFTPQRGSINIIKGQSIDVTHKVVQESTKVLFELEPQHAIYKDDDPVIIIEFPSSIQIQTKQCVIEDVSVTGMTGLIAKECYRIEQSFQIKNFLPEDYIPAAEGEEPKKIKFTVGEVRNAISVQEIDGLKVVIYAQGQYAIDEFEGYVGWKPIQGGFSTVQVKPSSPIAYQEDVRYEIYFTPDHLVPQNGYIEIDFPKEISVPDYSFSQSSCRTLESLKNNAFSTNQITCEFVDGSDLSEPFRLRDPDTPSHYTMKILNAFRRSEVEGGLQYGLEVPGLRNPIQTTPTPSFRFRTYDQRGFPIDQKIDGAPIRMTTPSELDIVLVTLDSYVNSNITSYTVTMVPTVPVWEQNLILVTFPPQIEIPDSKQLFDCTTVFESLLQDVSCDYAHNYDLGRTVEISLTFAEGVEQIDPLDRFSITMQNIRNPNTTQTTDSVQVRITDQSYVEINEKTKGILVTTNNAHTASAQVQTVSPQPGVESSFILTFEPEHTIDVGGGILIVYPYQTILEDDATITVEVKADGLIIDNEKIVMSQDPSARSVTVKNIVQESPYTPISGQKIEVTLSGLKNPYTSEITDSFQMTTFNLVGDTFYYWIDKVTTGLTINSKCNYPCQDCPDDDPSLCLSCYAEDQNIVNGRPFLQVDTCVTQCAANRFYDGEKCELCNDTCLSCFGTADTCTSCGIDKFLFLHQTKCLTECPERFIEDPSANRCKKCQGNCLTCEGLPTSCVTCDPLTDYKFFFHESCIDKCFEDISVLVDGKCEECDSKCKTCEGTPQTCTSCEEHMKLDPSTNTCQDLCEPEVQIFNELTQQCEFCADNCTKCAGSTNTCTACEPGYLLNFDQTCQKTCSAENQTPINGICEACEEPCFKCSGAASTCETCIEDYSLYLGTKCVQYCPEKYEEKDNVCVYEGLVCPEGFELNQSKDGCIPITFDCQPGYMINAEETACIPEPGSAVPFPFILSAMLLCLLVLGSYLKDKHFTKVTTNLIALIGALEIVMYLMMIGFAYALDEPLIMIFAGIGFLGLIATNILFLAYFRQQITVKDQVFVKWLHFFPKTKTWLPILILLCNFKFGKMFYSGFFGLDSTMARFGRHTQFFFLLRLTAYFSFVFCYGFIFIADVIILMKISWGYQLVILAIETIVLQLVVIILTIFEFRKGADSLLNTQGDQFAMIKPKNAGQLKVMGFQDDDDDYEEGIPDIDEDTLIRSKIKTEQLEINLRQQALARILNQVGKHPTEKGVDIQDCLTKFDPERIKMRRCFSMSGLDSDESWQADGDEDVNAEGTGTFKNPTFQDDEDEPRARRYSFPLTPRRQTTLPNTLVFEKQISDIKLAQTDFLIDNVYADTKPVLDAFAKRKVKTVSRRTQTYLRELLQVEGEEVHESEMEVLMEEEAELDYDFAKGLIANVIDHISSADESVNVKDKKKKIKKKVFKPKKEIPDFELADIMGDFEIDDMGNFIIMRGDDGELLDQRERLVNRRGYLIDRFGNVINNLGNIIFKAIELDVDDEIPAPFGFEKRKKNLLKLGDENQFRVESIPDSQNDMNQASQLNLDEELLDKEVDQIREQSKHQNQVSQDQGAMSALSQQNDQDGTDEPNVAMSGDQNFNNASMRDAPQLDNDIIDEEENLEAEIDQLVKKKVPRKRKNLKGGKVSKVNNMPPRRIRPEDVKGMFPNLSIEHDEQKRLAKIASSISGLANQLADKQRQQQLIEDRKHSQTVHSQPLDWGHMQDDQKLERVRQNQLNEIMAGSEVAMTEHIGKDGPIERNYLMQDRPQSNTNSLNMGGLGLGRQMSAIGRPVISSDAGHLRRIRSSNKPIGGKMRDRTTEMKHVYGQTFDLTAFDDQADPALNQSNALPQTGNDALYRPRRGYSSRPGGRLAGLETIYMTKIPKLKPAMNMTVHQSQQKARLYSASRPFRPTMDRFADDPSELNVNTTMNQSLMQGGGRDILEIADKLDQMQRDYLSHNRAGISTQKLPNADRLPAHQPEDAYIQETAGQHVMNNNGREAMLMSGVQSHIVQPAYPGLNADSRTNSGGKRFAPNSEANDSIDQIRKDNWVGDEE